MMEMQMLDGRCLVAYLWLCHTVITRHCIMEMCLILMYLISSFRIGTSEHGMFYWLLPSMIVSLSN
jgi:hypothetical protein